PAGHRVRGYFELHLAAGHGLAVGQDRPQAAAAGCDHSGHRHRLPCTVLADLESELRQPVDGRAVAVVPVRFVQ
nr:hypothetical protein [Tanacetum cinerariifolium]